MASKELDKNRSDQTIDLKSGLRISDMIYAMIKHIRLILVCALIGFVIGIILSLISYMRGEMSKQYAIRTTIGITAQNKEGLFTEATKNPSKGDIDLAVDLTDAVIYVIKSDKMLNAVVDDCELLGVKSKDLYDNLQCMQYNNTQLVEIQLLWRSSSEGVTILESLNKVAPRILVDTLKIGGVTVVNEPKARYLIGGSVNATLWFLMCIVGIMVGICIAVVSAGLRPTLRSVDDVDRVFHLEVLGTIPDRKKFFMKKKNIQVKEEDEQLTDVLDNYMSTAQIVKKRISKMKHPIIYLTSSTENEGRTLVTAYLGLCLSELGVRVLLVDMDTRNPKLGGLFLNKVDNENSINGLYHGDTTKEKAITSVTGKLDILPAILERVPLSYDSGMLDLVKSCKNDYDVILIDSLPVGQFAETLSLNEITDKVLFIVRFDGPQMKEIRTSIMRLNQSGIPILGCVVNRVLDLGNIGAPSVRGGKKLKKAQKSLIRKEKSIQKQEWEEWEKKHEEMLKEELDSEELNSEKLNSEKLNPEEPDSEELP